MKRKITLFTLGFLLGVSIIFVSGASTKESTPSGNYELVFETVQSQMYPDPIPVMWLFNSKTGDLWRYLECGDATFYFVPVLFIEPDTAQTEKIDFKQLIQSSRVN